MYRWLIIGGGIHGTHLAARLVEEAGESPADLAIIDPAPRLLDAWRRCTAATGMRYLRSPSVHHLGVEPFELLRYGGNLAAAPCGAPPFAAPYNRPALSLFQAHTDEVITRTGIADQHIRARAVSAELECDRVRIHLDDGSTLDTERLVLAIGASEQPSWPTWARALADAGAPIHHMFAPEGIPAEFEAGGTSGATVAVIGAGISGVQLALRLASQTNPVMLVSGHPLRTHQFDSEPGWLGPRFMKAFHEEPDPDRRRAVIGAARHVGSVPPALAEELEQAMADGLVVLQTGPVQSADADANGIRLKTATNLVAVDAVVLATGFEGQRPGGSLVEGLVEANALPCAACGYPVVDEHLRWHPRVFLTGPLAELELGPSARNIAGARRAAQRLVAHLGNA